MIRKYKYYFVILMMPILFIFSLIIVPLPDFKPYSKIVLADDGTMLDAYLTTDHKWRIRTKVNEVSPELIEAIIEKEDKWFYWHPGINPISIIRALYSNITTGVRVSGASTITMQVARMLRPRKRNYLNKLIEIYRAFQLELKFSKNEILELYLSYLPYGGNIEGVKAASYIYFDKPPNKLSLAQSIVLTVIPNNPNKRRPDKFAEQAKAARNYWIGKFIHNELFPIQTLNEALEEPLVSRRNEIRPIAPHFCLYVKDRTKDDIIKTTLNLKIQSKAESILYNHIQKLKANVISNGAVLIINNKNMSVVGYCGSADFSDTFSLGQVNGITSIRSPGSTLKPFLYALCFASGNLTPKMRLLDVPFDYGGYAPENYDLKYNGWVTAEYSLRYSLNIPAVRLLHDIGIDNFINILTKAGFGKMNLLKSKLGLSLILGGCGVTLEELTGAYSIFARGGDYGKLHYLRDWIIEDNKLLAWHKAGNQNDGQEAGSRTRMIYSPAVSYLIAEILSANNFDELNAVNLDKSQIPRIAWKTGTSYGKRDAWAIGFNPNYTIGVWVGNFNGKGSPSLSGSESALPLLIELFIAIDYGNNKWFTKPDELKTREVCAETGLLPSEFCDNITIDYYIANNSLNAVCNLDKEVYVSYDEAVQYCYKCCPKDGFKKVIYPFYPPELTLWFQNEHVSFPHPPTHNPECTLVSGLIGPKIISPSLDYEYYLEEGSKQKIALQAASDGGNKYHIWYVNDNYLAKVLSGEKAYFKPREGINEITCIDDFGRHTIIKINVKLF